MKNTNQSDSDMQLSVDQTFEAMEPYLDILESESGMLAMTMVSSVASANLIGAASAKDIEAAIQKASSMTGIPTEIFQLYAESTNAMISCYKLEGGI